MKKKERRDRTAADHYLQLYEEQNISAEHALKAVCSQYNALALLYRAAEKQIASMRKEYEVKQAIEKLSLECTCFADDGNHIKGCPRWFQR